MLFGSEPNRLAVGGKKGRLAQAAKVMLGVHDGLASRGGFNTMQAHQMTVNAIEWRGNRQLID